MVRRYRMRDVDPKYPRHSTPDQILRRHLSNQPLLLAAAMSLTFRKWNPEQEVREPEPEGDPQPREPSEGLQQEEVAHPVSSGMET
jgi:hypothetical protein